MDDAQSAYVLALFFCGVGLVICAVGIAQFCGYLS